MCLRHVEGTLVLRTDVPKTRRRHALCGAEPKLRYPYERAVGFEQCVLFCSAAMLCYVVGETLCRIGQDPPPARARARALEDVTEPPAV